MAGEICEYDIHSLKYEVFLAARDGDTSKLVNILRNLDTDFAVEIIIYHHTEEDGQSITPLIIAAKYGQRGVVHALLDIFHADTEQTGTVEGDQDTMPVLVI